jgi:hypothetical protein
MSDTASWTSTRTSARDSTTNRLLSATDALVAGYRRATLTAGARRSRPVL